MPFAADCAASRHKKYINGHILNLCEQNFRHSDFLVLKSVIALVGSLPRGQSLNPMTSGYRSGMVIALCHCSLICEHKKHDLPSCRFKEISLQFALIGS